MLRKFIRKHFMNDEREMENEIIIYSIYKEKWNAIKWIEL